MKCPTCGAERASRYAAYCHVCGAPLPELPPGPEDLAADQAPVRSSQQPTGPATASGRAPDKSVPAPNDSSRPTEHRSATPGEATFAPQTGAVRVFDRPDEPPSVARRKRLMWIMVAAGILLSLVLLAVGPLRDTLFARNEPSWSPPGTTTPVAGLAAPTLPPGISAAQATARARQGVSTPGPTWTAGVDTGPTSTTVVTAITAAQTTAATNPPATATATVVPPSPTPAAATPTLGPTITSMPTVPPTAEAGVLPGAVLPAALSGGKALAFVSDRTGTPQVWVMDALIGTQLQVTTQGQNTNPAWSFDNRYLYYLSTRDGQTGVYRLDISALVEELVLRDPSLVSFRPLANGQLATLRTAEGSFVLYVDDRRLFELDRSFQFQFSSDGRSVLIDPNSDPRAISVVDVATTRAREVAAARSWNAGWGPGGELAYVSDRTGIAAVYVLGSNADAKAISPGDKWSQAPAFSPNGSLVAFIAGDGPEWNVYVAGAEGQDPRRIGGPANPGKSPLWQPTGELIAYESNRAGNWDVYVASPNGGERPLITGPGNDVDPAWTW